MSRYQRGVSRRYTVEAENALACVATVITAVAPTVLRTMSSTAPAFGPLRMSTLYPRKSRANVWLVVIVLVVPAVAVSDAAPTVEPVDHATATAEAPAANAGVSAGDASCTQPSSLGL